MINTYSKFYYGQLITPTNWSIDLKEDGIKRTALLRVGSYTLTTLVAELTRALNAAGGIAYDVGVDRVTRKITISGNAPFEILVSSGDALGTTAFGLLGFSGADRTGGNSYQGDLPCGSEYVPPFMLQDYLDSADNEEAIDSVEVESTSGKIQGVSFGKRSFTEFNIKWVRAENYSDGWITTTTESLNELRAFMRYIREKHPVEFIKDRKDPGENFETIRLASTPGNKNGVGFELKEMYAAGLPGFYETGILRFRVI